MKAWRVAREIIEETKHPIWGELFKRVLTNELRADDIFFAEEIGVPRPTWISIIAGANSGSISSLADFILTDFIIEANEKYETIDNLEAALHEMIYTNGEPWDNVRLN